MADIITITAEQTENGYEVDVTSSLDRAATQHLLRTALQQIEMFGLSGGE
jgi:hypothetical protein